MLANTCCSTEYIILKKSNAIIFAGLLTMGASILSARMKMKNVAGSFGHHSAVCENILLFAKKDDCARHVYSNRAPQ